MTVEEVKALLESSNSPQEWNDNCQKVKDAHNDAYPSFWWKEIILSGFAQKIFDRWKGYAGIEVEII